VSRGQAAEAASAAGTLKARHAGAVEPALRRFLGWAVFFITSGYTFLDYWNYSRTFHEGGGVEWDAMLAGTFYEPAQYRIGVVRVADLLAWLTHTHLRHMFAAIDFVCLGVSLAVLLWLIARSEIFRGANRIAQWLQASLALGCFLAYLLWSFWYQKPETHATLLLLVLSAAAAQWRRRVPAVIGLIALAAAGATVRADAMVAFHAGFLMACLLPQSRLLPLGRATQAVASVLSVAAAAGVEFVIIQRLYPHAPRGIQAFQLFGNLTTPLYYLALAVALVPWWLTLWLAMRRWRALDGWATGLVIGSLVHFMLFYIFGIAWEVRIFLPFAMTLVPLTVTLAYASVFDQPRGRSSPPGSID
jgi:hypothetical protein